MVRLILAALLLFVPAAAGAAPITGRASVVDGNTIEIGGKRIRLHGIDAPEPDQTCDVRGREVRCGQQAALALSGLIGGRPVSCAPRERDRLDRVVAVCHAGARELNAAMVAAGWATADRRHSAAYIGQERGARAARKGIWQGRFAPPRDWRRGLRPPRVPDIREAVCTIKGDVDRRGERVYHVPGGRAYERVRIDPGRGERWFCSEREARLAGWRKARR